jgi:hypothetical protein
MDNTDNISKCLFNQHGYYDMFPKRRAPLVQAVIMSLIMVTVMTFVITSVNTGWSEGFIGRWINAYAVAWPIAFSVILIFGRRVAALTQKLCIKE